LDFDVPLHTLSMGRIPI